MSFFTLRHLVEAVVLLVFGRHVTAALRTFSPVKGERPAPLLQLFPIAMGIVIYKALTAPIDARLAAFGLPVFGGSLALYEWARRTVRGKFFSYAFSKDTPQFLLTSGPYAYIRNPFYSSYLLSFAGGAILFPGIATLVTFGLMLLLFAKIARHEERKFEKSALSAEYEVYRCRTGRFIPKLGRPSPASAQKP